MDIEEMKKYSQNKIEADNLIKQIRQKIKETTWEKQNLREGFTETFKPLISQFEDPGEDSKKQNIFTQNQKMLQNQLALTEGLKANQKAITDGFSQFEKLAEMQKLGAIEDDEEEEEEEEDSEDDKDDQAQAPTPTPPKSPTSTPQAKKSPMAKFDIKDFDKNLNNKQYKEILSKNGYDNLPSFYFDKNIEELNDLIFNVNERMEDYRNELRNTASFKKEDGYDKAKALNENPRKKTLNNIENYNTLSIYYSNLYNLFMFKNKSGTGLFSNPQELLRRFELLKGSLVAGNNGVLPEFIQIAHRLRDLGILTNNQLNKLLRKVI